jgi:hypothetical protein
VRSILLKGRSFEDWLYDLDEPRIYTDIDLLVARHDIQPAGRVLRGLGYRPQSSFWAPAQVEKGFSRIERWLRAEHARVWVRGADMMCVDLHRTLIGVGNGVDPWEVLSTETESMLLSGTEVEILSEPARALHVALHAMVHGLDTEKPRVDLARALERLPIETWMAAAVLAERLGAQEAFGAGLGMQPAGLQLAERLGLRTERSVDEEMFAESAPYSSWTLELLARTPGIGARLRIVARRVIPEPEFMRVWYPVARRGPVGLGLAYLRRFAWLAAATGPAVSGWWRARRNARRGR